MEAIQQSASGNSLISDSENEASFTISRNGDLIHKVYLTTDEITSNGIEKGSRIIKEVEISIGGQMIDRYTQEWQDIWNELTIPKCKAAGFKAMTGNFGLNNYTPTSKLEDKGVHLVQIPLLFWFCRNPGLALPLIALQYHEVKIDFKFNKNTNILHHNQLNNFTNFKLDLYIDYIYLDTDERRRFAQVSHEYLIEQLQIVKVSNSNIQELNINHPVKELIWTSDKEESYTNAKLVLNGLDRFEKQPEEYFQLRQPFDYHTSIPRPNLPNSAQHNFTIFTMERILDDSVFNGGGLTVIDTDDFNTQIENSPSKTSSTTSQGTDANRIMSLNNDFDFNAHIGTNHFLYYPTFSLRANHDSHSNVFDDYDSTKDGITDELRGETGNGLVQDNIYKFPGFFVNPNLLKDQEHDKLKHIFLPKNLDFMRIATDTIASPSFSTESAKSLYSGNLTYRIGNGDNNQSGDNKLNNTNLLSQIKLKRVDGMYDHGVDRGHIQNFADLVGISQAFSYDEAGTTTTQPVINQTYNIRFNEDSVSDIRINTQIMV
jgi:hypothetical protein